MLDRNRKRGKIKMMNTVILVGHITQDPHPITIDGKTKIVTSIAVKRNFKNSDGEYVEDFIPVTIWQGVASQICELCKKGDTIAIKGIVRYDNELEIVAEKVSFLSRSRNEKEEK